MAKQKYLGLIGEMNNVTVTKPYAGNPEKVKEIGKRLKDATQKSAEAFRKAHSMSAVIMKHKELIRAAEEKQKKYIQQAKDILVGSTIKFQEGNKIAYFQDHGFHRGMPHDVEFEVTDMVGDWRFELKAPGYGGKPYGNGSIFIKLIDWEGII